MGMTAAVGDQSVDGMRILCTRATSVPRRAVQTTPAQRRWYACSHAIFAVYAGITRHAAMMFDRAAHFGIGPVVSGDGTARCASVFMASCRWRIVGSALSMLCTWEWWRYLADVWNAGGCGGAVPSLLFLPVFASRAAHACTPLLAASLAGLACIVAHCLLPQVASLAGRVLLTRRCGGIATLAHAS